MPTLLWYVVAVLLAASALAAHRAVRAVRAVPGSRRSTRRTGPALGVAAVPDPDGHRLPALGLLVGLAAAAASWQLSGGPHRWALAAPALASAGLLAGVGMQESGRRDRRPQPPGARAASLVRRSVGGLLGRRGTAAVRLSTAATGAVLLACGAVGDGSGRALTVGSCPGAAWAHAPGGAACLTTGPWPGWFYAVPGLGGLLAAWAMFEVALAVLVRRRPVAGDPAEDLALRRVRARLAGSALALGVGPVLGATLLSGGGALAGVVVPTWPADAVAALGAGVVLASGAAWVTTLVGVLARGTRPAAGGDAAVPPASAGA